MKNLVIIVEEPKKIHNARNLPVEWFTGANGTKGEYRIETPLGDERTVKGTLLDKFDLSYITSELFYLDLTRTCNYRCDHCGIKNDVELSKIGGDPYNRAAKYVTKDFIGAVARSISKYPPNIIGDRKLFYGGGEPLINPTRFAEINHAFDKAESTTRIVVTNGLALPINEQEFLDFMDEIGNLHIMLTYTESHAKQYAALAKSRRDFSGWLPSVEPSQALTEKIRILDQICKNNHLQFVVNIAYPNGQFPPKELRETILKNAIRYVSTDIDGHRDPCSKSRETAIRFNGDLHPHCYDAFTGKNKLGVIGFLK